MNSMVPMKMGYLSTQRSWGFFSYAELEWTEFNAYAVRA